MSSILRLLILCLSLNSFLYAASQPIVWYSLDANKKATLNVELYLSSTCPHCQKADAFFHEIEPQAPWLNVSRYVINQDKNALIRFNQLLLQQHLDDFAVPSIFFCGSRWVGFATPETTGKDVLAGLNYCKEQIEKDGQLTAATVSVLKRQGNASMFQAGMIRNPSPIEFISSIALIDSFNPCALFCFLGFLSILFLSHDRKQVLQNGVLFILTIGVTHYLQQTFNTTFYELLPWLRIVAVFIGLSLAYMCYQYLYKKISTRLLLVNTFLLAFILEIFQQTCLMNWSYVFEQWLYNQSVTPMTRSVYQVIYHLFYLTAYFVIFGIYLFMIRTKWLSKNNRYLRHFGLIFLIFSEILLFIYPAAFSSLALSYMSVVGLIFISWIINRYCTFLR